MSKRSKSAALSYRKAARESASCPSCSLRLRELNIQYCPRCLFSLEKAEQIFPYPAPPLLPIMDHAQILNESTSQAITEAFTPLRKKFPQIKIYVCFVKLLKSTSPRLFGYWLLNKSPLATPGYLAETWLPSSEIRQALNSCHRKLFAQNTQQAFAELSESLEDILQKSKIHRS